jgi:hypothetical protein
LIVQSQDLLLIHKSMNKYGISEAKASAGFSVKAVPDAAASTLERTTGRFVVRAGVVVTAFALVFTAVVPVMNYEVANANHSGPYGDAEMKKIVLCHWDESGEGSYKSSGDVSVNAAGNGHDGHPKDIIPPYHFNDGNTTGSYPGKNWNEANEDIWNSNGTKNGGCEGDGIIEEEPTTGTLIVKKVVTNDDNGTKGAEDFSFKVNGGSNVSFEADGQTDISVTAGTYSVVENADAGYTTTYDNCSNLNIAVGQTVTCTITNNDIPRDPDTGTLTLVKEVVGSDTAATEWTLTATGPEDSMSGTTPVTDTLIVGNYDLSEDGPTGYVVSDWVCVLETDSVPVSAQMVDGDTVTLSANQDITCTITNTLPEGPRFVILIKKLVEGGEKIASDFLLDISGNAPSSAQVAGSTDGVEVTLGEGEYNVTENDTMGYSVSYSEGCSGNLQVPQEQEVNLNIVIDEKVYAAECVVTNTLRDGGGSSGGGGSSSGSRNDPDPDEGEVLGDTTTTPQPEVLGETTTLPVTGSPIAVLFTLFGIAAIIILPKVAAIKAE